jgi:hypothetical protein
MVINRNGKHTFSVAITLLLISGCASQGAKRMPADRFDYAAAIGSSAREQMLLNIVRGRYQEMPVFLEIGSVVAQYSYIRSAGVGYFRQFINNSIAPTSDTASAEANVGYSEFPTITYAPLTGEAFAKHLYSEIAVDMFFGAAQAGWSVDILMLIGLERFGAAENMSFGEVRLARPYASAINKLESFSRTIELFYILSDAEIIEFQLGRGKNQTSADIEQFLIITDAVPADMRPLVAELRQLLGITNANRFLVTARTTDVSKDEISIRTRSVMAIMKFMSKGIAIPAEHLEQGWVDNYGMQPSETQVMAQQFPFRMRSNRNRPKNAFAAVQYQDHWFYIDNQDIASKRTLEHLMILYQLMAPRSESSAPLLTLPTR